jgi:hypothetical protein
VLVASVVAKLEPGARSCRCCRSRASSRGTAVDDFPDTLAGHGGIPVSPGDPEAHARALEDVLGGPRRPDTTAARVWARQFDADGVARVYERTYAELCRAVAP